MSTPSTPTADTPTTSAPLPPTTTKQPTAPPNFTLHHKATLHAPLSVVSTTIFAPDEPTAKLLCCHSSLTLPDLFTFHSTKPVSIPTSSISPALESLEDLGADHVASLIDLDVSPASTSESNATEVSFSFTESVPIIFGFTSTPRLNASWTYPKVPEGEWNKVGIYRSRNEALGIRVVKVRKLVELGERTTVVEETCSVWMMWGLGFLARGVTDRALRENMEALEKMFEPEGMGRSDGEERSYFEM